MQNQIHQLVILLLCLILLGCSSAPPEKPLDARKSAASLAAKDPTDKDFNHFLMLHGYDQASLPLKHWDLKTLTLCALYFHTKLNVAKQQLTLAELSAQTAGIKQPPTFNAVIAHSNRANGDIRPFSYTWSLDIPISTNNKRVYQIAKAEKNVAIAQIDLTETAWQIRNQISVDLIAYHQNQAELQLFQAIDATQHDIVDMLEKRFHAGMTSSTELSNARLLALKARHQLKSKQAQTQQIQSQLAADVGLTTEKFALIDIEPLPLTQTLTRQAFVLEKIIDDGSLRDKALLNRMDLRRSMVQYAAAEIEIKLQAAQQIPDITLSPGILFEFGDKIWSLGFSSLLNMLKKNEALINEAKQMRAIQGAAFENLQATIIANINHTQTQYVTAKRTVQQADLALDKQQNLSDKMQKQFDSGLIGKLELTRYQLNAMVAKQQLLTSQFALLMAANDVENLVQQPLYSDFTMPSLTTSELKR